MGGWAAACIKHTHFDSKASAAAAKASHLHIRGLRGGGRVELIPTHILPAACSLATSRSRRTHTRGSRIADKQRRVAFSTYIHRLVFLPNTVRVSLSRSILLIALCRNCFFQPMKHFNQHTFRDRLIERRVMCMPRARRWGACVRKVGGWVDGWRD